MPLENLHKRENSAWGLWRVQEAESELASQVAPFEKVPAEISNPIKRLEFLAGRVLVKKLTEIFGQGFTGIEKDSFGKPFLKNSSFEISLSHSYPYVAAVLDVSKEVGIDVEQPKDKLLKVASRVLAQDELVDAGDDLVKHCIYWCAKESLIKIYGKKDLVLAENLRIRPFKKETSGQLIGRIIVNSTETTISLAYYVHESFVVVVNS